MAAERVPVNSVSQIPGQSIGPSLPSYELLQHGSHHPFDQSETFHPTQLLSDVSATDNRKSYANPLDQASNEQLDVKGWPDRPRKLRDETILTLFLNFCEVLVTLAPIAFIST
jgi:hypothetical protein